MKGRCSPSLMFEFLFKNYDKICVFDDCDSALLTRCDLVDIKVTRDEILTRIRYLLPEIKIYDTNGKNISKSGLKKEVFR